MAVCSDTRGEKKQNQYQYQNQYHNDKRSIELDCPVS